MSKRVTALRLVCVILLVMVLAATLILMFSNAADGQRRTSASDYISSPDGRRDLDQIQVLRRIEYQLSRLADIEEQRLELEVSRRNQ